MIESSALEVLKGRIAQLACGSGTLAQRPFATGHGDLDTALRDELAAGRLHELFAATIDDAASAAGFAAMLALRVQAVSGSLLWLRSENAGRAMGQLYMPGLVELGGDPVALVLAVLPDDQSLLRAAADAAACAGLGVLVIECWGRAPLLGLTASRRLALAAAKSGVTLFLLRVDADPVPSAAATRWSIAAAPSTALAAGAPGAVTIEVELLRRRAGPAGQRWLMEWDRDQRAFRKPAFRGAVAALPRHRTVDPFGTDRRRTA